MKRRELLIIAIALAGLVWLLARPVASSTVPPVVGHLSTPSIVAERVVAFTATLPAELSRPNLEPAIRDPFVAAAPPAPEASPPPPPVVQAPPPPPAPPPLNLRFAGRMTAPDGSMIVLAAYGETTLALSAGLLLPNGYRVDAIETDKVRLTYPSMDALATLEIPSPPRYEIR